MAATRNAWNVEVNALSAAAYLNECIAQFVERHEHATDAEVVRYTTKNGNEKIKLVVSCDDTRGRVNVEVGSTFALDWARVDAKFVKNHDALIVKERETYKGCKPVRKSGKVAALTAENDALKAQLAAMQAAMVAAGLMAA